MKIAPIDITHKNFKKKMMGFDPVEVSDFLRAVATQMEELIKERNDCKEALRQREMEIVDFKERDEVIKSTLTTAQKMSERIHDDAEKEAKLIVNDAQQQADLIVADARDSLKKIYEEISDLRRIRMQFESNLKAMAQAHIALLDESEKYMPRIDQSSASEERSEDNQARGRSQQISPLSADV